MSVEVHAPSQLALIVGLALAVLALICFFLLFGPPDRVLTSDTGLFCEDDKHRREIWQPLEAVHGPLTHQAAWADARSNYERRCHGQRGQPPSNSPA